MRKFMDIHDWFSAIVALLFFAGNVFCLVYILEILHDLGETGGLLLILIAAMFVCFTLGSDTYIALTSRLRKRRIQAEIDTERAIRRLQGEDY